MARERIARRHPLARGMQVGVAFAYPEEAERLIGWPEEQGRPANISA